MNEIKSFRDLIVWQKSMILVRDIYSITANFPEEERFGLQTQMRRCVVSIPSNLAEGFLRGSRKDYCRFVRMAFGSGGELDTQLEIAKDLSFVNTERYQGISVRLQEVMKMLNSLQNKLS